MSVVKKTSTYGDYYTTEWNSVSSPCNTTQQKANALYIYGYLHNAGWTINAIAGILGNMQAESSINPGRWQSDIIGSGGGGGYGLVQWTPYTKYTEWVSSGSPSDIDNNLSRIIYELENGLQWISRGEFINLSFNDFTHSTAYPSTLAGAFVICYERPADQSQSVLDYRGSLANAWYEYLTGEEPPGPTPTETKKKNHYNFVLFNRKRRYNG